MIIWVILIILVLLFLWWYTGRIVTDDNFVNIPAIHTRCHNQNICGDQFVCDTTNNRCKQRLGGPCSMDIDCQSELLCSNWICSDSKPNIMDDKAINKPLNTSNPDIIDDKSINKPLNTSKHIKWNSSNDILYF